jgi:NarL family two-component system response regulator LiaR
MIVDDHEMVRQGAAGYLEAQPDIAVVAQAESGQQAVALVQEHVPDVVLMDLVMPGIDGVEATRRIKDLSPRTHIIVLTSFHQDEFIFPALQAGAISYLLKDVKAAELVEAIHRAARGEATLWIDRQGP